MKLKQSEPKNNSNTNENSNTNDPVEEIFDESLDCKLARQKLYPSAVSCPNDMKCGKNQACADLSTESCQFTCLKKEECPCKLTSEGLVKFCTWKIFYPSPLARDT